MRSGPGAGFGSLSFSCLSSCTRSTSWRLRCVGSPQRARSCKTNLSPYLRTAVIHPPLDACGPCHGLLRAAMQGARRVRFLAPEYSTAGSLYNDSADQIPPQGVPLRRTLRAGSSRGVRMGLIPRLIDGVGQSSERLAQYCCSRVGAARVECGRVEPSVPPGQHGNALHGVESATARTRHDCRPSS